MQGKGKFSVAVFEWKSDGFASFEPVAVTEVLIGMDEPTSGEGVLAYFDWITIVSIIVGISTLHIGMWISLGKQSVFPNVGKTDSMPNTD